METNTNDNRAGNHERRPTNSDSTIKEKAVAVTFHEVEFGKGFSGALKLLQERQALASEGDECSEGSTVIDAKKLKEVRIEWRDEFGRVMTPKEAFKDFCHKFHGKGPGKKKQEKRRRGFERDQQSKRHHFTNATSQTVERMKEAQARFFFIQKENCFFYCTDIGSWQFKYKITRNKIMRIEKKCGSLVPSLILVVILSLSIHLLFILNVTNILSLFIWMIPLPIRTGVPTAGIGFNSGSPERRPIFHQPVDQPSDVRNPVIFNFGDSISDTGGSTAGFGLMYGFPEGRIFFHESTGRLCDGRLLIDFLCESLNTSYLTPYLESLAPNFTNGANFAVSASSLLPRTAGFSLHSQLRQFHRFQIRSKKLVAKGVKILVREKDFKKALYIIDIGMNDLCAAFHHLSLGHVTYGYVMNDKFPALISEIKVAILNIFQHGGKNFWVYNSGPLGCLPQELAASKKGSEFDQYGCLLRFNQFTKAYNGKLSALCEELRSELKEVTIVYVDVYTAKYELFANFTRYGFENPFMACCGYGGPPYNYDRTVKCGQSGYNVCEDGSKYVSWDGAHFTEAANAIVAAKILTTKYSTPQVRLDFFLDA